MPAHLPGRTTDGNARLPRRVRSGLRRLVAALGPRLPEPALSRLVALRSRRSGLAVGLPAFQRVLVLAPHPDDESLAAGGTLALLADAGARITLVAVTDGEASLSSGVAAADLGRVRRREMGAAAGVLGIADVRFLGHPDTGVETVLDALVAELEALVSEVRPDVVVLPWAGDDRGDHAALGLGLARLRLPRSVEVWGAEVWTPLPANRLVDISTVVERKRAAIAAHTTAHGAFDLEAILGLNRYRSIRGLRGRGHAEAFVTCGGDRYPELVAAILGSSPPG